MILFIQFVIRLFEVIVARLCIHLHSPNPVPLGLDRLSDGPPINGHYKISTSSGQGRQMSGRGCHNTNRRSLVRVVDLRPGTRHALFVGGGKLCITQVKTKLLQVPVCTGIEPQKNCENCKKNFGYFSGK